MINQTTEWQNRIEEHGLANVADIVLNENNWRTHPKQQYEALAESLSSMGWVKSITINLTTGNLVDGHARVILAEQKHQKQIPAEYIRISEEEELLALQLLDPLSAMAGTDKEKLQANLLKSMAANHSQGIKDILERMAKKNDLNTGQVDTDMLDGLEDPILAEKLREKWKTEVGQIWRLGRHRILCGDSTDDELVSRLFSRTKAKIAVVWTDPPYGVDYESEKVGKIKNDELEGNDLIKVIKKSLALAMKRAADDAAWYIWHATSTRREFEWILDAVGLEESQYLTWVKDSATLGWSDYHWQTEPCFYAHKAGHKSTWYGNRAQSTVLEVKHVKGSDVAISIANGLQISDGIHPPFFITTKAPNKKLRHIRLEENESIKVGYLDGTDCMQVRRKGKNEYMHPTEKPVELAEIQITNSSLQGGLVYDPFHGGGSGLVACEISNRTFYGVDLDPKWTAATIEKWHRITKATPILE